MLDMAAYEKEKGLVPADIYPIVQELYPKYHPAVHSTVKNPLSGVCLRPDAEFIVTSRFGQPAAANPRKRVKHEKAGFPHRLTFRLPDREYCELMDVLDKIGYRGRGKVQEGMNYIVKWFLIEYRKNTFRNIVGRKA